jgi:hypothetical protein
MRRFSSTVSDEKSRRPSGTMVTPRATIFGDRMPPMGSPLKWIMPGAARIMPTTDFRSVLLPAPLAPITATAWPSSTDSETP